MAGKSAAHQQFEEAVQANMARLIGLARAMLGANSRDAKSPEDLVQDALLRLFRYREEYDWSDGGWSLMAKSVARNVISCRRRKLGKSLDLEDSEGAAMMDMLGEDCDPAEAYMTAESSDQLRRSIEALPENWSLAQVLLEQQEMAYRDIATTLQATETQVKTWLHRARARLAANMREDDNRTDRIKDPAESREVDHDSES
jgi:RNA polymerase sigma-70 factor (ECF subfamily)